MTTMTEPVAEGEVAPLGPAARTDRTARLAGVLVWTGAVSVVGALVVVVVGLAGAAGAPVLVVVVGLALVAVAVAAVVIGAGQPAAPPPARLAAVVPPAVAPPPSADAVWDLTTGTDPVTGLLDRVGLMSALDGATQGADRAGLTLLFVRVEGGGMTRAARHDVLRTVAARLSSAAGSGSEAARIAPDTFVAVRDRARSGSRWAQRGHRQLVGRPIDAPEAVVPVTLAAAAIATDGFHRDARLLLAEAEAAAERVLRSGAGPLPEVHLGLADLAAVDEPVRWPADEVPLHEPLSYQPVIELQGMGVVGAEVVRPGLALDAAMRRATADFAAGLPDEQGWWLLIGTTEEESADPRLADGIRAALAASGLGASRLVVSVPERALAHPGVEDALRAIAATGVRLAVDGLGSGRVGLARLRALPFDVVRLSPSVLANPSAGGGQLCVATVELHRALGFETLARGVESGEELQLLCLAGADTAQGSWWSAPVPLDELVVWAGRRGTGARPPAAPVAPPAAPEPPTATDPAPAPPVAGPPVLEATHRDPAPTDWLAIGRDDFLSELRARSAHRPTDPSTRAPGGPS